MSEALKSAASFEVFFKLVIDTIIHLLPVIIVPILIKIYRQHKEQGLMIKKTLFENTGVLIFGEFGGQVQSEFLGDFLTTLFGHRIFDLIVSWNDKPSPNLIVPPSKEEAAHLSEIAMAKASLYLLQSLHLEAYFKNAALHGADAYKYCRILVALARPDANKLTAHDRPRIVAIELDALRRIATNPDVKPQWDTTDGITWVQVMRELWDKYQKGEHDGLAILEFPMNDILAKKAKSQD